MIYKLHYWFNASGANVFSILIGVFVETYTDASPSELGTLLMAIPFIAMFFRPMICSVADRKQAHRKYLIICLLVLAISYSPFIVIPLLGESVYREHARACWYIFMVLKVIGDVAGGGASSIGDSLAVNYAKRIGTSFTVYRVWGTISWMFFGIVIGQVNEISILPKYVPGFIILVAASLLDAFCCWIWPKEYFEMSLVTKKEAEKSNVNSFTKSLMPKEVVWAQAKQKLKQLFSCGAVGTTAAPAIEITPAAVGKKGNQMELAKRERIKEIEKLKEESREINKKTQAKILLVLMRRDPRIVLYLILFMCGGALILSTLSFFYLNLSDICHNQGTCDFSQLAGFLQVSMAPLETLVFIYISRVMAKIGRVNMAALAILVGALKFTFYGTIWTQVSPYYALLTESAHGLMFGTFLTIMIESGHLFSSEVQYITPELLEQGIISVETDTSKLKFALAATMQGLISSALDGFGRGLGALTYGFLLERISYETLWLLIGLASFVLFALILAINMIATLLDLRLGLDVKANYEAEQRKIETQPMTVISNKV